jgi:hypothetical protein
VKTSSRPLGLGDFPAAFRRTGHFSVVRETSLEYQNRIKRRLLRIAEIDAVLPQLSQTSRLYQKLRLQKAKHEGKVLHYQYMIDFWEGRA